jgi:uncharacterized membrane protein
MGMELQENAMGNESPVSHHSVVSKILVGFVAAFAVALFVFSPENVYAHAGESHGGEKQEAAAPAEPAPVEPETGSHEHAEVQPQRVEAAAAHPYPPEGVPRPLAWLGKLHPLATHFPIALLSVAALAELLLLRRPQELFLGAVRFCVWAGAIGALVAAPLGWLFAGFHLLDDEWVMTAHRWVGTGTALWALVVLVLCERTYRSATDRKAFRLALLLGAALVGVAGFLGGSLIYGVDHFAW